LSSGQVVALALAAVLVFWMLGAYNRLMRLRSAIAEAFGRCEAPLLQRAGAVSALVSGLEGPLAAEAATLQAVAAAQDRLDAGTRALKASPVTAQAAADFSVAMAALDAGLARLTSLCEHSSSLQADARVRQALSELRESQVALAFGRQLFNAAAEVYNLALGEFPTRLLVGLYRFGPAGRI
jgi:LemA protein